MSATLLPLELLLQVLGVLDARSFFAARRVCKSWYLASLESVTLRRLLETLPILPPVNGKNLGHQQIHRLSIQACRALMLGCYAQEEAHSLGKLFVVASVNLATGGLPVSFATKAERAAVFDGHCIRIFDTSSGGQRLLAQKSLEERLGRGLWLKSCPWSSCEVALASHGHLFAVAFKSTIQLYDLSPESGCCVINDSVIISPEQCITGLEFEDDDHLLRVHTNLKGGVVYLGSPRSSTTEATIDHASFSHWNRFGGLQNKFLDSTSLPTTVGGIQSPTWLSGLQILHPFQDGYLIAAQRHGGGQSSRYTVIHAKCTSDTATSAPCIDPSSITEIARLESFLSSLDFGTGGLLRHEIGSWEEMPSAHEMAPKFCLTSDKAMLVLAEQEKKRIWPTPTTQVFVYRLPTQKRTVERLVGTESMEGKLDAPPPHVVPSMPLCFGTVKGNVKDIAVERCSGKASSYHITALTDERLHSWSLKSGD